MDSPCLLHKFSHCGGGWVVLKAFSLSPETRPDDFSLLLGLFAEENVDLVFMARVGQDSGCAKMFMLRDIEGLIGRDEARSRKCVPKLGFQARRSLSGEISGSFALNLLWPMTKD